MPNALRRMIICVTKASIFGLRTGLLWNLLAVLPILYLFFVPKGSVIDPNDIFADPIVPISACILIIGLPCYVVRILVLRAKGLACIHEMFALFFCLTPVFVGLCVLDLAGIMRDLYSPYYADGGDLVKWKDSVWSQL